MLGILKLIWAQIRTDILLYDIPYAIICPFFQLTTPSDLPTDFPGLQELARSPNVVGSPEPVQTRKRRRIVILDDYSDEDRYY